MTSSNLREAIDELNVDANARFVMGAALNLYIEAMRRRVERVLFGEADVEKLFTIWKILLDLDGNRGTLPETRPKEPTVEEIEHIRDPFTLIEKAVEGEPSTRRRAVP